MQSYLSKILFTEEVAADSFAFNFTLFFKVHLQIL